MTYTRITVKTKKNIYIFSYFIRRVFVIIMETCIRFTKSTQIYDSDSYTRCPT